MAQCMSLLPSGQVTGFLGALSRVSWQAHEAVELATLQWVSWFSHHRLVELLGYIPPAEAKAN